MAKVLLGRLKTLVPLLFLVSVIIFLLVQLSPGDAAVVVAGSDGVTLAELEQIRERMGLNDPLYVQYFAWLSNLFTGDLGTSLLSSREVWPTIAGALPVTLSLTVGSVVFALLIAVPLGAIAAFKKDSLVDRFVTLLATLGVATPNFFLALLLILYIALPTRLFPTSGYAPLSEGFGEWVRFLILPSIALGAAVAAELTRHLRASLRDVLELDYIRTARSRGVPERIVVLKHGLKNAAVPVVTVLGLQISHLIGGSVVTESVFGLPGIGELLVRSVFSRDFPMIQGVMLVSVVLIVAINIIVDLSYAYFNPKVRVS